MSTEYRDRVISAIFVLIVGSALSAGLAYYSQSSVENGSVLALAAMCLQGTAILYFSVTLLVVVAAGVDFLKTIADQQQATIARKQAAPPELPKAGYKPRALGKPETEEPPGWMK